VPNRYSPVQENEEEAITPSPGEAGAGEVLLTVQEAARRLRIGRTTLYQYLMSGELESVQIGTRRFVPADATAEFLVKLRKQSHELMEPKTEPASAPISRPDAAGPGDAPQVADDSTDSVMEILQFLALVEGRGVAWADVRPRHRVPAPAGLLTRFREALTSDRFEVA
jgi:excisionase family DNA binding protein